MRSSLTRRALLLATLFAASGALLHAETWTVVVTGLNNPRGLAFGPAGALYIAEAGSGGDGPCAPGPEGIRCYGETGAITRYDPRRGTTEAVVTGLPSLATDGSFATGPHHVSLQGRGNLFFTIGFGGNPELREAQFGEAGLSFARIGRATANGSWRLQEDLGAFEIANNPTGDEVDSNPYGLLALPGKLIATDAGAQ